MKKMFIVCSLALFFAACGGSGDKDNNAAAPESTEAKSDDTTASSESGNPSYDPNRGEGKFHDVQLSDKLDAAMAAKGQKIAELKCESCHKMTDERLVGPGWKGVTSRHKPEWILNFVTNTDAMIDKDPKAQAMLEICMVRMPNQNLSDDEAREILEFMRKNDGVK
ncbi:MAG: cytochrome c [Bacteroidetes bacterium]|nr:cytochrome c [Bacteroidota bacterium]